MSEQSLSPQQAKASPSPTPAPAPLRRPSGRWRMSTVIGLVLVAQVAGSAGWIHWTPGLLLQGGLERLIDWGVGKGWRLAVWARTALDLALCGYWLVLLAASTGLGADAPPIVMTGEAGFSFTQRRVAYLPAFALLAACHLAGALIASTGWWVLALPFEMGGQLVMAVLLYVFLIPEGPRKLLLIEDLHRGGLTTRVHISPGPFARDRRWLTIRHDHLRGAELLDPLWARLCNAAHIELTYLDPGLMLCTQVVKAIGVKRDVAFLVAKLNGSFRTGRPLLHTLPPSFANVPQAAVRVDPEAPPG